MDTPPHSAPPTGSLRDLALSLAHDAGTPLAALSFYPQASDFLAGAQAGEICHVALGEATCQAVIEHGDVLALYELDRLPRFAQNPFVAGPPHVRSYLGCPVRGAQHETIGVICAFSPEALRFTPASHAAIRAHAAQAARFIEQLNVASTLASLSSRTDLFGAIDRFAALGYHQHVSYLLSLVYFAPHSPATGD